MNYIPTLTPQQSSNLKSVLNAAVGMGITNKFTRAAMLAVASKECEFKLHAEASYAHTSNDRIRSIFHRMHDLTDAQIEKLKADDKLFFNAVYGGLYGNTIDNAYMYVGRGFNQITFYGNYSSLGKKLGFDLINHPELLDNPDNAAKALVQYFKDRFAGITSAAVQECGTNDINGFKDLDHALLGIYHANAGWGTKIFPDPTGGFDKAKGRIAELYDFVNH